MSWRDTVMTQTELYDKLDEVTAERDALASRLDAARSLLRKCVTTGYSRHEINCFLSETGADATVVERRET